MTSKHSLRTPRGTPFFPPLPTLTRNLSLYHFHENRSFHFLPSFAPGRALTSNRRRNILLAKFRITSVRIVVRVARTNISERCAALHIAVLFLTLSRNRRIQKRERVRSHPPPAIIARPFVFPLFLPSAAEQRGISLTIIRSPFRRVIHYTRHLRGDPSISYAARNTVRRTISPSCKMIRNAAPTGTRGNQSSAVSAAVTETRAIIRTEETFSRETTVRGRNRAGEFNRPAKRGGCKPIPRVCPIKADSIRCSPVQRSPARRWAALLPPAHSRSGIAEREARSRTPLTIYRVTAKGFYRRAAITANRRGDDI